MELKLEPKQFEKLQLTFIREIIEKTMIKLVEAGIEGRQLEEATAKVALGLASIIDDATNIETDDGTDVKPYLGFRVSDDEVIHCGENSYTYDFVLSELKRLFDV